ncbi:hypothetical protein D0Y65_045882 [Glycine soja]|uniref:Uncharacterized protein n=1 Tax=Glycine soja TaxID=3848 RepID=A0A445G707_GLYSO|nr:hypothetical protein D0Y65_045882 [Glycine soja]
MMNDQPMPEAIKENCSSSTSIRCKNTDHFIRDFNIKPNVILYHTHVNVVSKKQKQKQKAFDHKFIPVSRNGKSW